MMRYLGFVVLLVSFIGAASAQIRAPDPAARAEIKPGNYSGRVQEKNGSGSAEIKMNIRHVTTDGRVTGTVESTHARKSCGKRLGLNGIIQADGEMRLTVDDGAPEGCERVYNVKVAGGGVTGTYIDAAKSVRKKKEKASS